MIDDGQAMYRNLDSVQVDRIERAFERMRYALASNSEMCDTALRRKNENVAWVATDYDFVTHPTFLLTFAAQMPEQTIDIVYLDADGMSVVHREIVRSSDICATSERFFRYRSRHAALFDSTVEGSYLMWGTTHVWMAFYNANMDVGIVELASRELAEKIAEYVIDVTTLIKDRDQTTPRLPNAGDH